MFKTTINTIRNGFNYATSLSPITQTRNATKRAAGSRTNKNDSAGRRLGPKVFEGNFVSPGQIIMRQRGTKIHPGENCGIGKDHTIFALEPGYVRFYYDPFHPLRKYVGIALKKDVKLPKPHFEPRLRRFGYVEIVEEHEALKEQNRMSRKEYLQQNDLKKTKEAKTKHDESLVSSFTTQLPEFVNDLNENELKLSTERLLNTYKLTRLNESIEFANDQSTFNYIIDIKHKLNKNEINESEFNTLKQDYYNLIEKLDSNVTVDYSTKQLTKYLNPTERLNLKQEILDKLSTFKNKIISKQDKSDIENLIATPLVFNKFEKNDLTSEYLPSILPESITDTVFDPENSPIPEGGRIIHRYNNSLRKKVKIGRTKEAFVSEL